MIFDWAPVWLSLRLATVTTVVLLLLATPLAWWLTRTRAKVKTLIEAIVALPLVLPPTVIGFYLLILLRPDGVLGRLWQDIGSDTLVFSFSGLVVGSVIYSLPFVVQPLQNAFQAVNPTYLEAAASLGAAPLDRFFSIVLPLARPGFLTAITLGFTHTIGEFGVVLMIGGNIPGKTRVISLALYDQVEALQYSQAHLLAGMMLLFSFVVLFGVYIVNRRFKIPGL